MSTNIQPPEKHGIPYDYMIVVDLEATCDENPEDPSKIQFSKEKSEIIEFSWVAYDAKTLSVLKKQQSYCKPENTPITPYCISLTKITPEMVENAGTLQDAVDTLDRFVQKTILDRKKTFCFVTHGPWDLKIQFPREAKDKALTVPTYLQDCTLFDLKVEFFTWLAHHPEHRPPNSMLITMCKTLRSQLVEPQHSGINDCLTIGNIVRSMMNYRHKDVFKSATNLAKIRQDFLDTQSNLVFFGGLPMKISHPEIALWLKQNNIDFRDLWMCRNLYRRPTGTGFAILEDHQNALKFLELNGSGFRNRAIEVIPSTNEIFKNVESKLSSWPGPYGILMKDFIQENSCIIHLSELPYKATQSELQMWFSSNNLRPKEIWSVSDGNNRSTGFGFVVFSTHHEAMNCLGMLGRSLNGRIVKLYPSSQKIFDVTKPFREPFPAMLGMRRPRPSTFKPSISSSTNQTRFMPTPPRRFHTCSLPIISNPNSSVARFAPFLMKSKPMHTTLFKPNFIMHALRQLCRK
ncbi:Asparagine-rich protein (ARP protein) [Basidiobolus ranarum]|uniref:Asparagine-rich protein (ARP protein) n=1 Tax=Basidiobolus ranarum TaxID=34480 RepID=A0ABR2WRQ9_9FUNG